jgi:hypothetical protein
VFVFLFCFFNSCCTMANFCWCVIFAFNNNHEN